MNVKNVMRYVVLSLYRYIFVRKYLFKLNKAIFTLSLRGIGVFNSENDRVSGEEFFLSNIASLLDNSTVIDVGANIGCYSNRVKQHAPTAKLYAFEPHPKTFESLKEQSLKHNYKAVNAGCGRENAKVRIYDYQEANDMGSSHASLYEEVISEVHLGSARSWPVEIVRLDDFIEKENIGNIRLVKIDVEGSEIDVIKGMERAICGNKIDIIQFEFNEMNVYSRTFLKDIKSTLNEYLFYRLLPDGMVSLGEYSAVHWEIFAYQNIVAVNKCSDSVIQSYGIDPQTFQKSRR